MLNLPVRSFLVFVIVVLVSGSGVTLAGSRPGAPEQPAAGEEVAYVPISSDLAVYPAPNSWLKIAKPSVSVLLLNSSFAPRLEASFIKVDLVRFALFWDSLNRTITISPRDPFEEGSHVVNVYLEDAALHMILGEWTFHQDTVPPVVFLDALPFVADRRVHTVNGTVLEANIAGVDVNGFNAIVDGERFLVPVLLWPGHNDLLVRAVDRSGNIGYGKGDLSWFPPGPEGVEYAAVVQPNASFIARFPTTWEVNLDYELEPGVRVSMAAFEPESVVYLRSSITIVTQRRPDMNEGLFLGIMQNAIAQIEEQARITIVSRPRLIGTSGGPVAAQFSLVDATPEGQRIFRHVTGFWDRDLGRIWIVIGSVAVEKVETQWHALQTAAETFEVIPRDQPPTGSEPPQAAVDRALLVTTAGILLIIVVFMAAIYSIRKRSGRTPFRR